MWTHEETVDTYHVMSWKLYHKSTDFYGACLSEHCLRPYSQAGYREGLKDLSKDLTFVVVPFLLRCVHESVSHCYRDWREPDFMIVVAHFTSFVTVLVTVYSSAIIFNSSSAEIGAEPPSDYLLKSYQKDSPCLKLTNFLMQTSNASYSLTLPCLSL